MSSQLIYNNPSPNHHPSKKNKSSLAIPRANALTWVLLSHFNNLLLKFRVKYPLLTRRNLLTSNTSPILFWGKEVKTRVSYPNLSLTTIPNTPINKTNNLYPFLSSLYKCLNKYLCLNNSSIHNSNNNLCSRCNRDLLNYKTTTSFICHLSNKTNKSLWECQFRKLSRCLRLRWLKMKMWGNKGAMKTTKISTSTTKHMAMLTSYDQHEKQANS